MLVLRAWGFCLCPAFFTLSFRRGTARRNPLLYFFGVRRLDAALPVRSCLRRGAACCARAWRNTFSAVILSAAKDLASKQVRTCALCRELRRAPVHRVAQAFGVSSLRVPHARLVSVGFLLFWSAAARRRFAFAHVPSQGRSSPHPRLAQHFFRCHPERSEGSRLDAVRTCALCRELRRAPVHRVALMAAIYQTKFRRS